LGLQPVADGDQELGVGIDPEQVPRLFLPFQSDKPNGMGLGLALAKKIVLLHGGQIRLTGERGRGATLVMEFPAGERHPA
jgi:signal transduction histidine kinase